MSQALRCPSCSYVFWAELSEGQNQMFCERCGTKCPVPESVVSAGMRVRYCPECGSPNDPEVLRCHRCDTIIPSADGSTRYVTEGGMMGGLIPRNPDSLWAYYLGILALIPVVGIPLGFISMWKGYRGLQYVNTHPDAGGSAHAWVGIILGFIGSFGCGLASALMVLLWKQ